MLNIKISDLYVLVHINHMTGEPDIYPRIFTNLEEAQKVADDLGLKVRRAFINDVKETNG